MVDEEVENILSQIRERVRAQPLPSAFGDSTQENGAGESLVSAPVPSPGASAGSSEVSGESPKTLSPEARERIESYLTTTARAWNRLPPLVSNRSGSSASLELWVKRQINRATHWFTWEQINFNAAVHHALLDTLETLTGFEQALGKLRAATNSQRIMLEQGQAALKEQRAQIETLRVEIQAQRAEGETQRAEIETQRAAREARHTSEAEAQRKELDARLSTLAREMQERFELLSEEQRVCFKQLSLETTEAAVLEDRARRKTESMLEEFRGRIKQLKKL